MAKGMPGADSSSLVTTQIGGRNLIELATDLFGQTPVVWGRYFTSVATTGVVEYRHLRENQSLRARNIRVLPIARQTKRVNGTVADGSADAKANAEDLIQTFGVDYLASQGGQFLMFLDTEGGAPSLSAPYYRGWAATLVAHSRDFSAGKVTVLPCVYGTLRDDKTWDAVVSAIGPAVEFHGAWIARWKVHGCSGLPEFDEGSVRPRPLPPSFKILLWQYSDACHGEGGFDCNETNPSIDLQRDLLSKCVLPPDTPMA
jgi:hypothetical protein